MGHRWKGARLSRLPVFGGLQTENVPFYWFINVNDRKAETAAAEAAEGVRRGFKTVYIKIGFDVDNDLAIARAIKEEVGRISLCASMRTKAGRCFRPSMRFAGSRRSTSSSSSNPSTCTTSAAWPTCGRGRVFELRPTSRHGCPLQVPDVIAQRAADVVVTDPHQLGGLVPFRNAMTMCETVGLPVIKHAFGDLAITTIATAHVLAAMPSPQLGHQQFLTFLVHDLLTEKVEFVDGEIAIPTGPGLGSRARPGGARVLQGRLREVRRIRGLWPDHAGVTASPELHEPAER